MTDISRRLEQSLSSLIKNNPILPVKTADGILVGDILIKSEGTLKHIYKNSHCVYKEISLNACAVAIANLLAQRKSSIMADKIYAADQEYGRWFVDSQMLRSQYQKCLSNKDFDRADVFWARYIESRDRALTARNTAQSLATI